MTSQHRTAFLILAISMLAASWAPAASPMSSEIAAPMPPDRAELSEPGSASITAPGSTVYLIPAAANSWGEAGTRWLTEVFMVNPWSLDVSVDLFYMPQYQDNTGAEPVTLSVPAGAALRLDDVVGTTLDTPGTIGAVLLGADWPLFVSSRTANHTDGGTYGQLVPALPLEALTVDDQPVRLLHLSSTAQFRTNLGFANAAAGVLAAEVDIFRADGTLLDELTVTLAPYSFSQLTDALADVQGQIDDAYAVIRPTTPDARFFTYASVVDRRSGDPTFVTPRPASTEPVVIPAVARVAGFNDTVWRSDLVIHNPSDESSHVTVTLLPGSETAGNRSALELELPAGTSRRFPDALGELFGYDGVGSLRLEPSGGAIMAMSRTYTTVEDQTLGQAIPGLASSETLAAEESVELLQLRHSENASEGFRTNIGFVNLADRPIIADVLLFDDTGTFVDSRAINLQPHRSLQINNIFHGMNLGSLTTAHAVVRSTTPGARLATYASVVDNQTGDPTFVQPIPMPKGR